MHVPARSSQNLAAAAELEDAAWGKLIRDEQWTHFIAGTAAIENTGTPFLLAGALALASYTGHWRDTKDVDVIVRASDREAAIGALRSAGFEDYFEQLEYDRSWIFRGFRDGVIFDVIWALPNHRVEIDDGWFERARSLWLRGRAFAAAPAEEIIRVKLYVMQRERCDWVDVLNILSATVDDLDWPWLVERMGADVALLHGVLAVFNWLCPGRAQKIPAWVRERFALPEIEGDDPVAMEERHIRLLDSRPWFALHQPLDRRLER